MGWSLNACRGDGAVSFYQKLCQTNPVLYHQNHIHVMWWLISSQTAKLLVRMWMIKKTINYKLQTNKSHSHSIHCCLVYLPTNLSWKSTTYVGTENIPVAPMDPLPHLRTASVAEPAGTMTICGCSEWSWWWASSMVHGPMANQPTNPRPQHNPPEMEIRPKIKPWSLWGEGYVGAGVVD